jgi:hypothetical protein
MENLELIAGKLSESSKEESRIVICYDSNGSEHYRDRKTGKLVSNKEAINRLY